MNASPPSEPHWNPVAAAGSRAAWRRLREAFLTAGWRREPLELRMGGEDGARALAEGDAVLARARLAGDDDFARIARFFLLGDPLPREELARIFTPAGAEALQELGLLAVVEDQVRSVVGWHPTPSAPVAVPLPGDADFPRGGSTVDRWIGDLAGGPMVRKGVFARCGGGELPVLGAELCETAALVECREAPAARAAWSAALRGFQHLNIGWNEDASAVRTAFGAGAGDADLVVLGAESWDDLLLPASAPESTLDAEAMWEGEFAWLDGALARLAPGGRGVATISGPVGDPGPILGRLKGALAARGCDGMVFASWGFAPEELVARGALFAEGTRSGEAAERLARLRERGVGSLRRIFVVLRGGLRRGAAPLFAAENSPGPIRGRAYEHLQRIWKGLEFLRENPDPQSWLHKVFLPCEGVEAESRCRVVKNAWSVVESELATTEGAPFRTHLSATLPGIVPYLDGVKTLGGLLAEAASSGEYPWESYLEDSLPIVQRLIARGQLVPARPKLFLG